MNETIKFFKKTKKLRKQTQILKFKQRIEFIEKYLELCEDYQFIITTEEYSLSQKLEHEIKEKLK